MTGGLLIDAKYNDFGDFDLFRKLMPGRKIINWQNEDSSSIDPDGIHYALGWKPDAGLFASLPDLKVMFSIGAGVDHMLSDPALPNVPLVRFVDTCLTDRMSEWVCLQCLMHLRQHPAYSRQQTQRIWCPHVQPGASDLRVGIMGLGVLGQDAARKLKALGFRVNGWSRSMKSLEGINCFSSGQLDQFLSETDILVGLLPLTKQTTGIFNASLFARLPGKTPVGGPVFINAGRGGSHIESDIVHALRSGVLSGASLDVFEREPLDPNSPLWTMDNVILTPHVASVSDAKAMVHYVVGQIRRFESGLQLQNLVDRHAEY